MNKLILYLIQSGATLAILYSVYWFFLRKETFFSVNRFYLITTVFLSLIIPLVDVRMFQNGPASTVLIMLDPVLITPEKIERMTSGHLSWFEITGIIYFTGVAIFFLRFLLKMIQLIVIIVRNKISRHEGANIVFVDRGYSPFSFFNLIFIRKEYYIDGKLTPVIAHEKVHIRQYHTLDLLLMEIAIIVQWFNPFVWFLGRSVKSTHEFLADEGVLSQGFLKKEYQTLILNEAMGLQVNNLTNNFNISLIKNRIAMMTKTRSAKWSLVKIMAALPALFAIVFLFSAGTLNTASAQNSDEMPDKQSVQQSQKQSDANPAINVKVKSTDQKTGYEPAYEILVSSDEAKPGVVKPDKQTTQKKKQNAGKDEIFTKVETMPKFPGGEQELYKFILNNLKYPEQAKTNHIQGKVFVTFVIEKDGSVSNITVLRGIGGGCDEEAVRVVKAMPKWSPGLVKGKPVRVQFNLPFKFSLE